ncbi:hypothetical protein BC830DRAFT_582027 [Chytriomyces sp. MP71]|nr:hypothetical protein BC830DRAFT_582027 [Chytriomyces sp. MP71]
MSSGVFLGPGESKLHARRNSHVSDMLLMPPSGGAGGGGGSGGSRRSSSFEIPIHGNAHAHYAVPLKEEEVPHSARSDTSDSEAKGHSSSSHLSAGHASATANSLTGTLSHVKSVLMQDPRMAAVLASLRTASATIERTVARLTRVQKHALASLLIASFLLWLFLSLAKGRSNSNSPAPMPPTYDDDYGYERGPKIDWGPGVNGRPACNRAAPWCIIRKGWNDLGTSSLVRILSSLKHRK